jgi:hypothetical protein
MNLFDEHDWTDDAACRGMPDAWFYGEEGSSYRREGKDIPRVLPKGMRNALVMCWNKCPVRVECLTQAITRPEDWGIWGGTLPIDRRGFTVAEASARGRARAEAVRLIWEDEEATG